MKFSTPATRDEKPHCGMDLVPFMKSTTSFFVTIAIAESGMLAGFVLTFVSQGGRPFFVGLGLFAIALTIVLVSLSQVEIEADGTSAELIR